MKVTSEQGGRNVCTSIPATWYEKARVPFAHAMLVKLPDSVSDEQAMMKNLTLKMGNCNHRKYIPKLVRMVAAGTVDPTVVLTHDEPLSGSIDAFESFDRRESVRRVRRPGV